MLLLPPWVVGPSMGRRSTNLRPMEGAGAHIEERVESPSQSGPTVHSKNPKCIVHSNRVQNVLFTARIVLWCDVYFVLWCNVRFEDDATSKLHTKGIAGEFHDTTR